MQSAANVSILFNVVVPLQYDVNRLPRTQQNPIPPTRGYSTYIGHRHVADSPGRNEPGLGEPGLQYLPNALATPGEHLNRECVCLAYHPLHNLTHASFDWLPRGIRNGEVNLVATTL